MTYDDLKGKKVLVTGASSGIGAATAVAFARQVPLSASTTSKPKTAQRPPLPK